MKCSSYLKKIDHKIDYYIQKEKYWKSALYLLSTQHSLNKIDCLGILDSHFFS